MPESPTSRTPKKLLVLDPSSTCTGYAILNDYGRIIEAGRIKPTGKKSAIGRIDEIVQTVVVLLNEHSPDQVLVEITAGKSARRLGGKVQGLGVYGMAVGAIRQACRTVVGGENVMSVEENVWTNSVPKRKRLQMLRMTVPEYRAKKDPGGDVGDAVGLGLWWLRRNEITRSNR